ncbi:MAG: helix-turn-helix transcriptional regulator [Saprospirales bacterium]|nr:helix-turn-helix transcriptional regulator [Saprospirales bacterium]
MSYSEQEQAILIKLGNAIRERRKAKGWSQEELAFQAGLDRTYIGSIERGERNIAALNLVKIANVLGIRTAELLEELG